MDSVRSGPFGQIVRPENLTKRTRSDAVHGSGFQVDQDRSGNILSAAGLVVIHVDPLQLEVRIAVVGAGGVDAVLIGNDFPELCSNLVAALAGLNVDNFPHDDKVDVD